MNDHCMFQLMFIGKCLDIDLSVLAHVRSSSHSFILGAPPSFALALCCSSPSCWLSFLFALSLSPFVSHIFVLTPFFSFSPVCSYSIQSSPQSLFFLSLSLCGFPTVPILSPAVALCSLLFRSPSVPRTFLPSVFFMFSP